MSDNSGNIDRFEKQFGVIAIENGFINPDMLIEALKIQVEEDIEYKTHRLIGEILMEKGFITGSQIQDVLDAIFKK